MAIKLGIHGACGKMGVAIAHIANARKGVHIVSAVDRKGHPLTDVSYGEVIGESRVDVTVENSLREPCDVIIDFSSAKAFLPCLKWCSDQKSALVVGTTGLTNVHKAAVKKESRRIPILMSSNMSIGVNVLFDIVPKIAGILGDEYDIEIVETHHRHKKDAPSGTAVTLVERLQNETNATKRNKRPVIYGRKGDVGARPKGEIAVHALRSGSVVGEHRVIFGSEGDTFEIIHRAHSRDIFAAGAVTAAMFLANAKPGIYTMADIMQHRK